MTRQSVILFVVLLTGLMLHPAVLASNEAKYQAALEQAQSALEDAAQKVQLWSTSEILLEESAKAAASGNFELAVKLVKEAGLQVELALATAEREKKVWQKSVPR